MARHHQIQMENLLYLFYLPGITTPVNLVSNVLKLLIAKIK